jgi:predicted GTPase
MTVEHVLIMGAAGRDFHDFNVCFRDDPRYRVVAFTAAQIPDIAGRRYPAALAGPLYPEGIPILEERELADLVRKERVDQVVFAYSDVAHEALMHKASVALAAGADFRMLGPRRTMLASKKPVVSVCAVRTGSGKSPTTRRVCEILKRAGKRAVVLRHPMPYGDLAAQRVQRFAELADLDRHRCTIEEREEYEPHLRRGTVVYAGVDYEAIGREAEQEADVIVWDGGNNDVPFFRSDLEIVVADPHRPGHELSYHPGETNLRRAHAIVINKIDTADGAAIERVRRSIAAVNPAAAVIDAASPLTVSDPTAIRGRRALVVEDGPTLTHGEMPYGAGTMAARKWGAAALVDPRPFAVGSIRATFAAYPGIGPLLPAMGYGDQQIRDLEATIAAADCDLVVVATPIDLGRVLTIGKPSVRVSYDLQEIGRPTLEDVLAPFLA